MNGELAQIITLVTHGNFFLRGRPVDLSANSAFQYVSAVKFVRYKNTQDQQGVEVAGSVSEWFAFLRSIKATRLWNIAFAWHRQDLPEHIAVSFSGGVPTAIQADLPDGFELWYPRWQTGSQDTQKPWLVEYRGLMFPYSHVLPVQKMSAIKDKLRQAVSQAETFAKQSTELRYWVDWFERSLATLDSASPTESFQTDLLPATGFSFETRQVLASAVQSYVFGGMGSWNDLGFEKPEIQEEYERVTKELYEAVKYATVMASNSFES